MFGMWLPFLRLPIKSAKSTVQLWPVSHLTYRPIFSYFALLQTAYIHSHAQTSLLRSFFGAARGGLGWPTLRLASEVWLSLTARPAKRSAKEA